MSLENKHTLWTLRVFLAWTRGSEEWLAETDPPCHVNYFVSPVELYMGCQLGAAEEIGVKGAGVVQVQWKKYMVFAHGSWCLHSKTSVCWHHKFRSET